MSDIIRLNKNCLHSIQKIRNIISEYKDFLSFDISICNNSMIVEIALNRYAKELEEKDHELTRMVKVQ